MIETERLIIKPLTYNQLEKYILNDNSLEQELELNEISRSISPELKEALEKTILPNVADTSKNYLYSTLWTLISKKDNKMVGDLCFVGAPNADGEIEIGYGTYDIFAGKGFMTEAVGGMISWAKKQPEIFTIIADTEKQNTASFRILEKNGFVKIGETETLLKWKLSIKSIENEIKILENRNEIISKIRQTLIENADEKTRESSKNFFKEEITVYGVKSAIVQKISKEVFSEIKDKPKAEIFAACEKLWKSGYLEESFVACVWSEQLSKIFEPSDFETLERWIKNYVSNWASCDTLCNHTVGDFVMKYPEFLAKLKEFAHSENRWVKRAAAVSLIIPARKGLFLKDIFEISDTLLMDSDDLLQKGYGWMLKAASQAHQQEVFEYVMSKKAVMPRTALRYAIEKMPDELKKQAMQK